MTSQEFIIWMKGFVSAAHDYTPTPKQWEILKDELSKVSDYEDREQLENDFFGPMDDSEGNERNIDAVEEMRKYAEEEMEKRMDIIGQNGNEGTHYDKEEFDDYGQRILSPKWTSTNTNEVDDDEFDIGGSE
jgi:hypothetical protein